MIIYSLLMIWLCLQLADINRHPWVTAGGKGELELELPMMEVVQTHIIPSVEAMDPDVLQVYIDHNIYHCYLIFKYVLFLGNIKLRLF